MIKKINPNLLLLIVLLLPLNSVLWNYSFRIKLFEPISKVTNNIIQPTLIANLTAIFIFSIIVFYFGRLSLKDFLITKKKSIQGIKWSFIIWIVVQSFALIYTIITQGKIEIIDNFNFQLGQFLGQLFGNALFEEIVFRGLLLTQFYIILKEKMGNRKAIITSVIVSQLIFSFMHIPNRVILQHTDYLFLDLIKLFIVGVIFALIYIQTKNLILLIGVHTLINTPFVLNKTDFPMPLIVLLLIVVLIFWNKLATSGKNDFWKFKST